jgi:RNA polymerase sigma-70 factor (ECF subfamily)
MKTRIAESMGRSAEFQSAVSRFFKPHRHALSNRLPIENRRYGRLQVCATIAAVAASYLLPHFCLGAELTLDSAPPVVVRTVPVAGAKDVDPALTEIRVTYSKTMRDGSWAWSKWQEENFPETNSNKPPYLSGDRTCVLPMKLQPGKSYALWLHGEQEKGFKDVRGTAAVPYLLSFKTAERSAVALTPSDSALNADQRAVLAWTDRQFRSFFDARTFDGWSPDERATLERRLIDALNGPRSTEYYQAINTLAAMRSTNALPRLREIAFERVDRNNRDRWMCVRALGLIGDKASVPDLIHLVYHGNQNTHWWAQITLVRLTGRDFGGDWEAWGKWWNESGGQPAYKPEIIRWWNGQPENVAELKKQLAESDAKFLGDVQPR